MSEGDKTELPTPKKLRDAAAKGDVLQSRDLSTALVVAVGVAWVTAAGTFIVSALKTMLATGLRIDAASLSAFSPQISIIEAVRAVATPVAILLAFTLLAAIATPMLTGSFGVRWGNAAPKWSRVDPLGGLKRMFGTAALGELGKSVAKVLLIGGVCIMALYAMRWAVVGLAATNDPRTGSAAAGAMINRTLALGGVMLGLIALIDVPWQAMRRRQRLMMTKDEVTREHREADGSPELKRERRSRQYALSTMSARGAMKEATVVLTNPTHFAVALRYDPDRDAAPVVVARGVDEAAAAIRDLAKGHAVPCLDYPALTRAIYFTSKVGDRVREDLFLAVATVLAFVMNIEAALAAGRRPPDVDVPEQARFGADGRRDA
jgi:flagellar biosynthesis protein FlhB